MIKSPTVGLFVKDYLLEHGPSSTYNIWKAWVEVRKKAGYKIPSYQNFYWNFVWQLKRKVLPCLPYKKEI